MKKNEKLNYREAILALFLLVEEERMRRELFDLLGNLKEEFGTELARELANFLLTGRDTLWIKSRLLMRFYCIAKHVMGFETANVEEHFDLQLYHLIEAINKSKI